MAYGLDISSSLSMLVGLSRAGGRFKLKKALVLPGFDADPNEPPSAYQQAALGETWGGLKSLGVAPGTPATLVPGRDVYYRFSHVSTNAKLIEAQVKLEADEIAGDEGGILADYVSGVDFEYAPAIHVTLAREEVIDHFANCLSESGVEVGPLMPGCVALYNAYKVSGDQESEHVTMHVNIGDDNTDVILVREGSLLFARSLGIGVRDFIQRLLPEYGGDEDAIRQILFRQVDLRPSIAAENLNADRGIAAAQEVAAQMFQQISGSVMLAKSTHRAQQMEPRKIVISGPGAAIPGMRELMMNRIRKTVEVFDPFANIITDGADGQTADTIKSYKPALALAVGLAVLATDTKRERAEFLPSTVRRRREFLHKSLFLYLAAAAVMLAVVPLYVLSSRAAATAEQDRTMYQQAPIGRYAASSAEIETFEKALADVRTRANASLIATGPGRKATDLLMEFSNVRPESVRIRSVKLDTDTSNPARDEDFKPTTRVRFEFFIERRPGADPNEVNTQVRRILQGLPGVTAVRAGSATDDPVAQGLNVVHTVELKIGDDLEDTTGGAQ
jgi:Tfp pilus assembly PilM family ATPase